jgi:orotate phosphoribosyltransferase-like protein
MTSDASWSTRARKITELELPDHAFLCGEDECYYFGDYTPRKGFSHSKTNQTIWNIKKPLSVRGTPQWKYKNEAIAIIGKSIAESLNRDLLPNAVLVAVPPSKPPAHAEFDDRIERVVAAAIPFKGANVLKTAFVRNANHVGQNQRSAETIYQSLEFTENAEALIRKTCILVDDVLTTGASFLACKRKLLELNGVERVLGFFAARCAWERSDCDVEL